MKRKMSRNKRKQPKSVLRLPDLEVARTSFYRVSRAQTPNAGIATPSMNLSIGTVRSLAWHSTGLWSFGTGAFWSPGYSLQARLTSGSALCGAWPTKPPIVVS